MHSRSSSTNATYGSIHPSPSWKAENLDFEELVSFTNAKADSDEVTDLLSNGWERPSPHLFQHFRHAADTIRQMKDTLEEEEKFALGLFERMKKDGFENHCSDFINRKRWFPNCSKETAETYMQEGLQSTWEDTAIPKIIKDLPNFVKNPRNPPAKKYKITSSPFCWHCS
jgi:hypothetical protein